MAKRNVVGRSGFSGMIWSGNTTAPLYPIEAPPSSLNRCGAGHNMATDLMFSDLEKSNAGGTPLSPGYRQYVFHPVASRISTPARTKPPASTGLPAISRTAERVSPSHDDASAASAVELCTDMSSVLSAAIETHCRNVDAIMRNRLTHTDPDDH